MNYANEQEMNSMATLEMPERLVTPKNAERRVMALDNVKMRASGDPERKGEWSVRGHAAVFDKLSLDLGGFRERIAPDAFDNVLNRNPEVFLVWDHDTKRVLAGTNNKSLELRTDEAGLVYHARVLPFSYAQDLRLAMDSGLIQQASFAFTVDENGDTWEIDEEGDVTRTITEVADLFDVTITAQGAYPQTDSQLVTNMRSRIAAEIEAGRLPETAGASLITPEVEEGEEAESLDVEGTEPPQTLDGKETPETPRLEEARARAKAQSMTILRELKDKGLWQTK